MANHLNIRPTFVKAGKVLSSLRKSIRNYFFFLGGLSLLIFCCSPELLEGVQEHLGGQLYFFSVAGPFLAHVKLALFGAFFLLVPWAVFLFWQIMGRIFGMEPRPLFFFIFFSCALFYAGVLFCYFITLPYGVEFLLGFGSDELKPVISVGRCINFVTIFILAFGLVFELPVLMTFFSRVHLLSLRTYQKHRRYAVLFIAVLSAMLTPTPDVVNMALMGGPLYLLYEAGICIVRIMERVETSTPSE